MPMCVIVTKDAGPPASASFVFRASDRSTSAAGAHVMAN
jgi:hypothetical protein